MPSIKCDPGSDHQDFLGTIRPIDDPFWNEHRPGTDGTASARSHQRMKRRQRYRTKTGRTKQYDGLENNPGKDGKPFSDKHPLHYWKRIRAKAVDALTRRINEMIAEMPDNLTLEENRHRPQQSQDRKGNRRYQRQADDIRTGEQGKRRNPNWKRGRIPRQNCQTCTVTHIFRRLGFDIEAKPNIRQSAYNEMAKQGITWEERFPEPGRNKAGL